MQTTPLPPRPGTRSLRFVLWITQLVLALTFAMSGWLKLTYPLPELGMYVPWANSVPEWLVRFIGASEVLGAAGLVLPALTRVKPGLTPLSAALLAVVMLFAAGFHLARGETAAVALPLVLFLLAAFTAWARAARAPILPKAPRETPRATD